MQKKTHDWITKARVVKTRPALPTKGPVASPADSQTARLTALLKGTLKTGAVKINAKDLPIKLKSLRTQVFQIAKKQKAISHVLANGDGTISMWLEPRPAGKRTTARPNNGKPAAKTPRTRMTAATKPQASEAKPIVDRATFDQSQGLNRRATDVDDIANEPAPGIVTKTPAAAPALT
jgi:hypothetical protein